MNKTPLSSKTVHEHHVVIHTILRQGEKELLIPYNPAAKATPPKVEKTTANYLEIDEIAAILKAVDSLPLKWKLIIHLHRYWWKAWRGAGFGVGQC